MRIAHIVSTYPPYYGGMGNAVFALTEELARRGHDVEVLTPGYYEDAEICSRELPATSDHAPALTRDIARVKRLAPSLSYGNAARLPTIARELDTADIVHLHYPFFGTANLVRRWKLRHPDRPLIITYHMDTRAPGWKGLVFSAYARWWLPKILTAADRVIATSFDYARVSQAREVFAAHPERWVEIPLGVDTNRFLPRPTPAHLMSRYGLSADVPTVLFVGGMDSAHYFKGVEQLLLALTVVKKTRPIQAVLVGGGNLRETYIQKARGMGLSRDAHFVGRVSDAELPAYYNLADLMVLPSTTAGEAFGMVLLEAMASGVPVIASDLPGVRTIAKQGGVIVPPRDPRALADAIIEYHLHEYANRQEFRDEVRQIAVSTYAWPVVVEQIEAVYESLASNK